MRLVAKLYEPVISMLKFGLFALLTSVIVGDVATDGGGGVVVREVTDPGAEVGGAS